MSFSEKSINMTKGVPTSPNNGYEEVSTLYPLANDGDSVYVKDIDLDRSSNGGFTPLAGREGDGTVADYFNSLTTVNCNSSGDNPKTIEVRFWRTIQTARIGFGCDDLTKNFGSIGETITVKVIGSGDQVRTAATKEITLASQQNSFVIDFEPQSANGVIIEFNSPNEICLSNLIIYKSVNVNAKIQAIQDDGVLVDASATNKGNLKVSLQEYGDTPAIDAFARQRFSQPFTIFDSKQLHDKQPLFWDEELGGSATSTHNPVDADTVLEVTANASDYVIRQTRQRFNYQPGKSQLIFMTFRSPQVVGLTKRVGPFDGTGTNNLTPNNGIFFECDGNVSWNIAKNGTTTETVLQADWNVDKLDGTGPSEVTLDLDAPQILIIDYEWLGVGRVRVGFVIGGLIIYVHDFNHANDPAFPKVYMSTPNLPLRYDIQTDGTAGSTLDHICSTVISEGGIEKTGILRSVESRNTFSNTLGGGAGTKHALCGIRLKSDYLDVSVIPESISDILDTNDEFKWELHLNPTINGTWTYNDLTDSAVQFAQVGAATNNTIATDGLIIARGGASNQSRGTERDLQTALRIGSSISGVRDELVLVHCLLSNNQDAWACFNFRELL